jgi:phosphoenolpyruvate phosphomutase
MVHGDDWLDGPLAPYRKKAIEALASYGGQLIEIPYTNDISSSKIVKELMRVGMTPENRKSTLKRLLGAKDLTRIIETHSPISALIAENASVEKSGKIREFDGFWSSSLTDSIEMGKPDIEALDISSRLHNINNIFEVTTKPLIMDIDTGGKAEHLEINIKTMERLGISAVIMEDKMGLKRNSLLGNDVKQSLEAIDVFCEKIKVARQKKVSSDFMIIARIESLILEVGMTDAINRAFAYVEAGADGIMIHSRKKEPQEIFEFAQIFRKEFENIPLVSVPTTYNTVYEDHLVAKGFNVVIYANHLMRASYPAMVNAAKSILLNSRSSEIEDSLIDVKEALSIIPGTS